MANWQTQSLSSQLSSLEKHLPRYSILAGNMQAEDPDWEAPSKTKGQSLAKRKFFISVAPFTISFSPFPFSLLYSQEVQLPYRKTRDDK